MRFITHLSNKMNCELMLTYDTPSLRQIGSRNLDEPHPVLIKDMLQHCVNGHIDEAYKTMAHLWRLGYSPEDIITIVFRVCKNHSMPEFLKLEFIKVC
jgi:hypothetical protein